MLITKKSLLTAATLTAFVAGAAMMAPAHAEKVGFEKCGGIAKASSNDCKGNGHSCAGQAAKDRDPMEFVLVPAGTCDKIAGGTVMK